MPSPRRRRRYFILINSSISSFRVTYRFNADDWDEQEVLDETPISYGDLDSTKQGKLADALALVNATTAPQLLEINCEDPTGLTSLQGIDAFEVVVKIPDTFEPTEVPTLVDECVGHDGPRCPEVRQSGAPSLLRRAGAARRDGHQASSPRCASAAPMRPANSGCALVGRDLNSGCAWVAT